MISNNGKVIAYMLSENTTPANLSILSDKNNCVKINADLQDYDWNRNRRKYPKKTIESGIYSVRIQELLKVKSLFGEAGHPIDPTVQRQCTVLKDNISHRILSFDVGATKVKGIVKTTNTPRGLDMRNLILDDDAMIAAFSLRAMGPMVQTAEGSIVQAPLTMIDYDWVDFPSHPTAYQTQILNNIQESGNTMFANECIMIPLLESSAIDFIKQDSNNFKLISGLFEYNNRSINLSEDCKNVIITNKLDGNNTDKIVVGLEGFISHDINNYFDKFR